MNNKILNEVEENMIENDIKNAKEKEKNVCFYFGCNNDNTEKWAIKYMIIWQKVITLIYLIFGSFTFAPINFIIFKIQDKTKKYWISLSLGILIYIVIIFIPIFVFLVLKNGG